MKIRPVILSGGSGTRLWPISRRCFPKQFAHLTGGESFFVKALRLTNNRSRFEAPIIVGNAEHKFLILDALHAVGIKDANILLEPAGRNTAAAAITAAFFDETEALLHLVMPSDHIIADSGAFIGAVQTATTAAKAGHIVLFGTKPTHADIGLGYIVPADQTSWKDVCRISSFREKPDTQTAIRLIESGALWNAGIFLYSPAVLLSETKNLAPEYTAPCRDSLVQAQPDLGCLMLAKEPYAGIRSESFDRLIMEKTNRGCVVPCAMGLTDAGSWQAIWEMSEHDTNGNALVGSVVSHDVQNAYVHSEGPMVAVVGLRDIAVIATRDAVLIAPRERSQDVKNLVAEVERIEPGLATHHTTVARPWGSYQRLAQGDNFQVKHIIVEPGRSLSLQKHHHRAEHWVVVGGTAKVERDGVVETLFPNESVFVARGSVHRLSNPGKIPLHLIEVQSGDYLGEDDIIRLDDPYGQTLEPDVIPALTRSKRVPGAA